MKMYEIRTQEMVLEIRYALKYVTEISFVKPETEKESSLRATILTNFQ